MLKESIKDLINAIAEGDSIAIEDSFSTVMASKISDRLDDMRVSVAQNMFGSVVEESVELDEASETKFVNVATSKAHIARAQKALNDSPDMFHGAKAGFKRLITIHKKHLANAESNNSVKESLEDYSIEELEDFMMSEDFEQLDELSKKTLGSYVTKAHDQLMKHTASVNFKSGRGDKDVLSYTHEPRTARKTANRTKGVATAIGKLTKEEVEELDELSKKTLGSYVKKATTSAIISGEALGKGEKWSKSGQIASKREKGIGKAVDKMTKEEFTLEDYSVEELEDFMMSEDFEQLDELSKATLSSYVKKASLDNADRGINYGYNSSGNHKSLGKMVKRSKNIDKAVDKLTKD